MVDIIDGFTTFTVSKVSLKGYFIDGSSTPLVHMVYREGIPSMKNIN